MSNNSKVFSILFKLQGVLDATFTNASKDAINELQKLGREAQRTANLNQLKKEHTKALGNFRKSTAGMSKAWGALGRSILLPIRNIALFGAASTAALFGIANSTAYTRERWR